MKKSKRSRRRKLVYSALILFFLLFLSFFSLKVVDEYQKGVAQTPMREKIAAFNAYHLSPEPRGAPSREMEMLQILVVEGVSGDFRQAAVMVQDTQSLANLPQVMPGAFGEFLQGEVSAKFPLIWPYVLSGSSVVLGNTLSAEPIVAFYNPYFDVAILTKWAFRTDSDREPGFRMVEAYPVNGRAFIENRASVAEDQPIWAGSDAKLFELGLVKAAQNFMTAFKERYPPAGNEIADLSGLASSAAVALSTVEDRVFYLMRWVIDAQNPDAEVNYADGIKQLHEALSASSEGKLQKLLPEANPQKSDVFFNLPRAVREGMQPYLVIDKNVIFVNPLLASQFFLSVYFEQGSEEYQPELVLLFDLSAKLSQPTSPNLEQSLQQ